MSKSVRLTLIATLVALAGATSWVPKQPGTNYWVLAMGSDSAPMRLEVAEWRAQPGAPGAGWTWLWNDELANASEIARAAGVEVDIVPIGAAPMVGKVVDWPLAAVAPTMILLLGGMLALVMHTRERRRRAASG